MEFYSPDMLSGDTPITLGSLPVTNHSTATSSAALQLSLIDYRSHIPFPVESFYSPQSPAGLTDEIKTRSILEDSIPQFSSTNTSSSSSPSQSPHIQHPRSVDALRNDAEGFRLINGFEHANLTDKQADEPVTNDSAQAKLQPKPPLLNLSQPTTRFESFDPQVSIAQLQFQLESAGSNPVTSDCSIDSSPGCGQNPQAAEQTNLNAHEISNSILNPSIQQGGVCLGYPLSDYHQNIDEIQFQSCAGNPVFIGFNSSSAFSFQNDAQSDHELEVEDGRSHSSPIGMPHSAQSASSREPQAHAQLHSRLPSWNSFNNSPTSGNEEEQRPISPTDAIQSSPPGWSRDSNMYFPSSRQLLYEYPSQQSSLMPLSLEIPQSIGMIRAGSNASEFSDPSPVNTLGVNPIHVNPLSQPATPQDDLFPPLSHPLKQSWWVSPTDSHAVDSFITNVSASMDLASPPRLEKEKPGGLLASIFSAPQQLESSTGSAGQTSPLRPSPYHSTPAAVNPRPPPPSTSPTRRRTSHRSALSMLARSSSSKASSRPFLVEPDYSRLPTKRSRGRRPPISPDLGLPIPDGHLLIGLQPVPGGQAFDPNLNPNAETVKYCELTKTGKPKKIFICQVKGCGKCFKRSEHLKRHVRSIHTNDKPYNCPWMACMKSFSRHDNLNQHLRVHRVEEGGEVLNGLHIGSDGVLRSDLDESPVEPTLRGLRNVEVVDRYMLEE